MNEASVRKVVGNLEKYSVIVNQASQRAVKAAADDIFDMAQVYVPVDTGSLKRSGKVTEVEESDLKGAIISYGDDTRNPKTGERTSEYAVKRHERFTSRKPDAYKWLEKRLLTTGPFRFEQAIVKEMDDVFK